MNRKLVNDRAKEEERRIQQKVYQELLAQMEKERREYEQKTESKRQDEMKRKSLHKANANDPSDMIKEKNGPGVAYKAPDSKSSEVKIWSPPDRKEIMESNRKWVEGKYSTDKTGVYDVMPEEYQSSKTYKDIMEIMDGVDFSDQSQRSIAMTRLGKYMGERGLYYDSNYMKENEESGMVREREVERGEREPRYTDFDLQLVTVAYNSLRTGYALEDMVVAMEEEAPYRARGEQEAREAAEASGKYTFEGNPEGAFNAVISETNEHINDLQYELDFGIASRGAAYYWITGQDMQQVIKQTQEELENEQTYLEVLEKMKDELNPKDYDPNYMMHTYVGGERGIAEAYIEDAEKELEELTRVVDLHADGRYDEIPEKYRGLSYEELTARQIAQGDAITDLKQRKWSEEEGVKRPALEAKAHAQEDFEEKALEGAGLLPVHESWEQYPTEKSAIRYINDEEYREFLLPTMVQIGDGAPQWEWEQLTEEEKDVLRYYAAEGDYESVKQYLEGISP